MKVFFSYAQSDRKKAEELASRLKKSGHDVWDPAEAMLPGENWALRIGQALQDCNAMVFLLSPDSVKSEWARKELEYALGSEQYRGRLIPVEVKRTSDVPWILKRLQIVRWGDNAAQVGRQVAEYLKHGLELRPSKS